MGTQCSMGGGVVLNPQQFREALLWPSVINDNVNEKDFRTHHEALPVIRGDKFAANAWLHLRNFRDWADRGCV